ALIAEMRQRQMLVILDNFEQILAAASEVIDLLTACSAIRALVTSRASLGVRGERLFNVKPFALPPASTLSLEQALTYPSVRLFVELAQFQPVDVQFTETNLPAIITICRALDGLPLAIELVISHLGIWSVEELARQITTAPGLHLLRYGPRD